MGRADDDDAFEAFFETAEPRLRAAFTALYGADLGREATAEALTWAWQHWPRLGRMTSPIGYLYRVGQSRTRRLRRRVGVGMLDEPHAAGPAANDPALVQALAELPERQRVAVVLAHGYGWPHAEIAELLGVSTSTVATHVSRGLERLRSIMEVDVDA